MHCAGSWTESFPMMSLQRPQSELKRPTGGKLGSSGPKSTGGCKPQSQQSVKPQSAGNKSSSSGPKLTGGGRPTDRPYFWTLNGEPLSTGLAIYKLI